MPQVVFYQLTAADDSAAARAATLIADAYANKQKVVALCRSQEQAEELDELLWQLPSDRFVPHNLHGEGPAAGTPVEICWQGDQLGRQPMLVNLSEQRISSMNSHRQIIDFVPVEEDAKQAARVRYKEYQKAGCAMQFKSA
ncbi:DNA polymerase III subunit chi [Alteromonas sp. CYL-A6]|uniref:DNA polymerase III subunit chi n=1 Tax=Alteromonas nitratireducens TaxID=3390813 RepID=UPI0034B67AAD